MHLTKKWKVTTMTKKHIILRPDGNGGVTVFTNEDGFGICFDSEETAKNHLYELGYTDESFAEEGIVIDTIDVSGVPEFLVQFVYDALINNEPDLSACYYIDDTSYRIATTADRDGWNCELLCYNTIDNDDVVLENIVVDKRSPQKIPEAIKYLYNEYVERMEKDEDESESEEEEDDEPDCQICGCQTDLYLIKDFNGKGLDARLCGKCLLKEALRKGKILISNAHFEKDGEMLSAFDYLKTVLDIKPLKKHNNLHQIFAEDKANHPMPPEKVEALREVLGLKEEKTYIDMLTELSDALEKDSIPEQDKIEIEIHLNSLKSILWNYSS